MKEPPAPAAQSPSQGPPGVDAGEWEAGQGVGTPGRSAGQSNPLSSRGAGSRADIGPCWWAMGGPSIQGGACAPASPRQAQDSPPTLPRHPVHSRRGSAIPGAWGVRREQAPACPAAPRPSVTLAPPGTPARSGGPGRILRAALFPDTSVLAVYNRTACDLTPEAGAGWANVSASPKFVSVLVSEPLVVVDKRSDLTGHEQNGKRVGWNDCGFRHSSTWGFGGVATWFRRLHFSVWGHTSPPGGSCAPAGPLHVLLARALREGRV